MREWDKHMIQTRQGRIWLLVLVLGMTNGLPVRKLIAQKPRILECTSTFLPESSAESLAKLFGAGNVRHAQVDVGEGQYEDGTVVFADSPEDKIEILWMDIAAQRQPKLVRLSGK